MTYKKAACSAWSSIYHGQWTNGQLVVSLLSIIFGVANSPFLSLDTRNEHLVSLSAYARSNEDA